MLEKKAKEKIIKKFKTHESDTGSAQVQIAILTEEIKRLTKHLKDHKKDFSSRRGLLKKVAERRKLLKYFRREDEAAYEKLIKDLKLKVVKADEEIDKKKIAELLEEEAKRDEAGEQTVEEPAEKATAEAKK